MEPIELPIVGSILTALPQPDGSFSIFNKGEILGTVVPKLDSIVGLRWEAIGLRKNINYTNHIGDLIGELIEEREM